MTTTSERIRPGARSLRPPVELRIARLRGRIASERVRTRVLCWALEPRLRAFGTFAARLGRLPHYAAKLAPYALPVAGLVFRRNRFMKVAMRCWGALRLARTVARTLVNSRRRQALVLPAQSGTEGEFQ